MTDKDDAGTAAELDEAQRVQMTKADLRTVIELTRANAQMAVALRSVARWATDEKLTAAERINIIAHQPQVRAASQEAPASPAADMVLVPREPTPFMVREGGPFATSLSCWCAMIGAWEDERSSAAPASNLLAPSAREDANPAPASPSPGLDARIEERDDDAFIWIDRSPLMPLCICRRPKLLSNDQWRPIAERIVAALRAPASPKDVHIEHTLAASPSPGIAPEPSPGEIVLRATLEWIATRNVTPDKGASVANGMRQRALVALAFSAPAPPSPGLREAVIEECAKEISNLWFGDLERKLIIRAQAAIRALSHPVSERGQP